jgi:hypothetical protein
MLHNISRLLPYFALMRLKPCQWGPHVDGVKQYTLKPDAYFCTVHYQSTKRERASFPFGGTEESLMVDGHPVVLNSSQPPSQTKLYHQESEMDSLSNVCPHALISSLQSLNGNLHQSSPAWRSLPPVLTLGQGRHLPRTRTITPDIVNDAFGADIDDFLAQTLPLLDCTAGDSSLTSQAATLREGRHPYHVGGPKGGFAGAGSTSAPALVVSPTHEPANARAMSLHLEDGSDSGPNGNGPPANRFLQTQESDSFNKIVARWVSARSFKLFPVAISNILDLFNTSVRFSGP